MAKGTNITDLRGRSDEELTELIRKTQKELLDLRFQNYTNRLNDTSQVRKLRRSLARVLTVRTERSRTVAAKQGEQV